MSEYQYYEFVAVDRPLNDRQLRDLRALSTRAQITPTSFVNEYHWGDFRGDPRALMKGYFDAFLYVANWGTHWLMIGLPARLLDLDTARRYCAGETISAWPANRQVVIDIVSEDESGDWVDPGDDWLASIIPVRAELAAGDLRALYLAWLLSVQLEEVEEDEVEPPVPPGLQTLSASLTSLVDFLRIDHDLLDVAATASPPLAVTEHSEADLARWIEGLSNSEKDALILRVAQGDGASLQAELLRRFRGTPGVAPSSGRTAGELLNDAELHCAERDRRGREWQAKVQARAERDAAIARDKRLEELAQQEEQAWQRVSTLIDTKKPGEYDVAVALLTDLQAVGERADRAEEFERRMQELRVAHRRKPSLMDRFDRAGLGQRMPTASAASSRSN